MTSDSSQYVGVVKTYNAEKGWGHLECAEAKAVYGKDVFVLRSSVPGGVLREGDQVRFSVRMQDRGPCVQTLEVVHSRGGTPITAGIAQGILQGALQLGTSDAAELCSYGGLTIGYDISGQPQYQYAFTGAAGQPAVSSADGQTLYRGIVKSYSEEKGWGHIQCEQTKSLYCKDIFLLRSELKGQSANVGDEVTFSVNNGTKGAQATNVTVLHNPSDAASRISASGSAIPTGVPVLQYDIYGNASYVIHPAVGTPQLAVTNADGQQVFSGVIKNYNDDKGWGHISCEATRILYGKDIFVMRSECKGESLAIGDQVNFSLAEGIKGVQAAEVTIVARKGELRPELAVGSNAGATAAALAYQSSVAAIMAMTAPTADAMAAGLASSLPLPITTDAIGATILSPNYAAPCATAIASGALVDVVPAGTSPAATYGFPTVGVGLSAGSTSPAIADGAAFTALGSAALLASAMNPYSTWLTQAPACTSIGGLGTGTTILGAPGAMAMPALGALSPGAILGYGAFSGSPSMAAGGLISPDMLAGYAGLVSGYGGTLAPSLALLGDPAALGAVAWSPVAAASASLGLATPVTPETIGMSNLLGGVKGIAGERLVQSHELSRACADPSETLSTYGVAPGMVAAAVEATALTPDPRIHAGVDLGLPVTDGCVVTCNETPPVLVGPRATPY